MTASSRPAMLASVALAFLFTVAPTLAQTSSAPPAYPRWTGSGLPFRQHLAVMLVHFDDAAIAMARTAQSDAKNAQVKRLAADVVAERARERARLLAAYEKRYGGAPPAWPGPETGGSGGYGIMGRGYGPGMMYGSGAVGADARRRSWYGPMMGYGDEYQMMMGGRANWWSGASDADTGFVPALLRLDGMQIAMASLALTGGDAAQRDVARTLVAARGAEVARIGRL